MPTRAGLKARARRAAAGARLLPGAAPPAGRIESITGWIEAQPAATGSRVLAEPAPPRPPRLPARTVQEPHERFRQRPHEPEAPLDRPLRAAVLPGARLATAHGLVVSRDNRVFDETAWDEDQLLQSGILSASRLRRARRVSGTHASLVAAFCTNYFHWLTETLPRLAVLDRLGLGSLPLIVPDLPEPFQRDSLALLGIGEERLTTFDQRLQLPGDHLRPDVLVWPEPAGHTGHPAAWACAWLREHLVPGQADRRARRLYVSRSATGRTVKNEGEVTAALERFGVEVVLAERLTFAEQVRLFSSAELVCGPHGAGLANAVFATEATVVELLQPSHPNPCIRDLAAAAGHRYWYLFGSDEDGPLGDYRVPVDALVKTVEHALSGR
jgi:capsular polysaccharide biosynthesis protein